MASLTILGLTLLLLLLLLYKYIIHPTFLSPLSAIPSAHFSSPITSLWIWSQRRTSAGTRAIYALHQRLGPAVRLGPSEISVCTPGALRTVYIGGFEKTRWYLNAFVNYDTQNMVSMVEKGPHSVQKRMVSNVYSKSFLQNSPDMQTLSSHLIFERFLPIVQAVAEKGVEMNVLDFLQGLGMDFTSAYLFGLTNATNFMNDVEYRHYWLADYKIFKDQTPKERAGGEVETLCFRKCEAAERFLHSEMEKATEDPLATNPVVYSRLTHSLNQLPPQSKPASSSKPTILTAASEMLDHLIAGHETSGITLSYLIHSLSQRPRLQDRLRNELLTLQPPLLFSTNENNALPSPRTLDALPLLDSLLNETLRLYAAAPAGQPRVVPPSPTGTGTTIEGYPNIPAGTIVSANAYTLHRNAGVFPEPLEWIGERWMDAQPAQREEMKRWFWAFGSGGRMCVGSNFALQEMKLVAAAIYTNFRTEIVDDEGIEQGDTYISRPVGEKLVIRFKQVHE